jgi:hypothetical protein
LLSSPASTYPVAARKAIDSFSVFSNCGITRDWTGVGAGSFSSSCKQVHISVNNPMLFHDFDAVVVPSALLCFWSWSESSALFLGIRKGARDFDMADSSEEEAVEE